MKPVFGALGRTLLVLGIALIVLAVLAYFIKPTATISTMLKSEEPVDNTSAGVVVVASGNAEGTVKIEFTGKYHVVEYIARKEAQQSLANFMTRIQQYNITSMYTNTDFRTGSLVMTLQASYKIRELLDKYAQVKDSFTVENSEKDFPLKINEVLIIYIQPVKQEYLTAFVSFYATGLASVEVFNGIIIGIALIILSILYAVLWGRKRR